LWTPENALFLEEADTRYTPDDWRQAMPDATPAFLESSYHACDGWPEGLRLALAARSTTLPLHRHPAVASYLERLLPQDDRRDALRRVAAAPLVLDELQDFLGVSVDQVATLFDQGYLYPQGPGLALPRLLRRYLARPPDSERARWLAAHYNERRLYAEALESLADAQLWEAYLERLAESYDPQAGEMALRRHLRDMPPGLHAHPAHRYLVGLLERLHGRLEQAQAHYLASRKGASGELRARIDNARGVTYAIQGKLDQALQALNAAARGARTPRLRGEALYNRAGVLVQQQRHADAEEHLKAAVALFRESAEHVREARTLQLLALSYHQRGLLKEARRGYENVLELLGMLGQPTALIRMNLAEVLLLLGEADASRAQLDQAALSAGENPRARAYVQINRALWYLTQGQAEAATPLLQAVLSRDDAEAFLKAEAQLVQARLLRSSGRPDQGLAHARAAGPLGLRAALEEALCLGEGLDAVIATARQQEARFELTTALLHRGRPEDLREALELIRTHEYRLLLDDPQHVPRLAAVAQQEGLPLDLFPLRMSVFGPFRVKFLGSTLALAAFPTRKSAALLVHLALAGQPLPREVLAEALWGEAGNPLHSLQTALYHLSRSLNAQVVASRRGSLELLYPVVLDYRSFERAVGDALHAPWPVRTEAVREALALAQGEPFLEFPEWFEEERRRAETLKITLLRRLVELEAPQPHNAAEALEVLLKADPYDLESRRTLIGIYANLGQADLARREEERLRLLEQELQP
jgi:DNA-binding SARP family transcriptional activator